MHPRYPQRNPDPAPMTYHSNTPIVGKCPGYQKGMPSHSHLQAFTGNSPGPAPSASRAERGLELPRVRDLCRVTQDCQTSREKSKGVPGRGDRAEEDRGPVSPWAPSSMEEGSG